MESTMYLFLIIGFVQLVSARTANITEPATPTSQPHPSVVCPELPSYVPLLHLFLAPRRQSENLADLCMPSILKRFKVINDDNSINVDAYKKVISESPDIVESFSPADLEKQVDFMRECSSLKGADEFETYKLLWSCLGSKVANFM
ncbi:uncharacterized protein LOC130676459 [Microplitis mediator]|uniref:uncharacterized protein LOC130676459 n=1 Tax=Microplitis mediator TaxID=375433 RepID=UPI00255568EF|nr:uncharacterized protein LOC130676459 [Microplitis mediator]